MGRIPRCWAAVVGLAAVIGCADRPVASPPPAVAPVAAAEPGWWHQAVFHEIFVRSFADATTGPLAGDGIGDLAGLLERLDHVNDGDPATDTDLGATALWLMPVMLSPSPGSPSPCAGSSTPAGAGGTIPDADHRRGSASGSASASASETAPASGTSVSVSVRDSVSVSVRGSASGTRDRVSVRGHGSDSGRWGGR